MERALEDKQEALDSAVVSVRRQSQHRTAPRCRCRLSCAPPAVRARAAALSHLCLASAVRAARPQGCAVNRKPPRSRLTRILTCILVTQWHCGVKPDDATQPAQCQLQDDCGAVKARLVSALPPHLPALSQALRVPYPAAGRPPAL